ACHTSLSVNLTSQQSEPQRVVGSSMTYEMLPMLGVNPLIGRLFREEDDRENSAPTVILSYALWQANFGGRASVLGETIRLDDQPYTVIGVMPRTFRFPNRLSQLWRPMRFPAGAFENREDTFLYPIGRLKPGVTRETAQAEMRAIMSQLERQYPVEQN